MGLQPVKDAVVDQNFRYLERLIRQAKPVEQIGDNSITVNKAIIFRSYWVGNGLYWTGYRVSVLPVPDLGITVNSAGVAVKLKTGGGIAVDSSGLYLAGSGVWPIGSVFLSVVSTNPATLLGIGTWVRIAEGQMLVGFKTDDPDFGIVEGTGGAKTATPDAHAGGAVVRNVSGITVSDHTKVVDKQGAAAGNVVTTETHTIVEPNAGTGHDHGFTQPNAHAAMSILNPYFTVYMWKRTA